MQKDNNENLRLDADKVRDSLIQFIKEQTLKAGFSKAIIGVSGGVDSAVVATLTTKALEKENVLGVILPYRTSNPKNVEDAKLVIQSLGIQSELVDISTMVDSYCENYKVTDQIRRGNIMARMRMIVLYDLSARERALVIGTSNKSEILVGYGTQYGDLACAINPLGELYKTQIWQLAEALGISHSIIKKAPSADLWEGQTDEGEIGIPYSTLDALLIRMIDEHRTEDELVQYGFDRTIIKKVQAMNQKNEFKRRLPIIASIMGKSNSGV